MEEFTYKVGESTHNVNIIEELTEGRWISVGWFNFYHIYYNDATRDFVAVTEDF